MSDQKTALEKLISALKQQRDELEVQMHLADMDAKVEYERISAQLDELTQQFEPLNVAVTDTAENIWAALSLAADEMQAGYQRVQKAIDESSKDH